MKAATINRFGGPEVFEISKMETPQPADNELLIEVEGGSVNPVDWKQRKGNHKLLFGKKFPIVLGYDVAGKVIQTGKMVTRFKAGDLVCGVLDTNRYGGGLAQFACGTEKCFSHIPDGSDRASYAVLPLAALTSLQALRDKGSLKRGNKVLIIGAAGGVGHFAVQIARMMGAEITAVSSERHKTFLETIAPVHYIDYRTTDFLKLRERFHVIYDAVGKHSFMKCRHLLLPGGTYINTLPRPKILLHKLFSLFTRNKKVKALLMKHSPADLEQLVKWVEDGSLKLCIDREFAVTRIADAHAYSEQGHTQGKILIRYTW